MTVSADAELPVVAESVGPPLTIRQVAASISLGVISLLLAGVIASVLGALQDEHRLSAESMGICATLEALVMGLVTGAAAAWLPANRLRLIGCVAAASLGVIDIATMGAHSTAILVLRTLAGVPDGILLWITIGMIARTAVPARWAGVYVTSLTASQLLLALGYAWIIPRFGADGAFAGLGLTAFAGVAIALCLPQSYGKLPTPEGESGMPPLRGWVALFASLLLMAAIGAVGVYVQPLAHEAGLNADVARTAVAVSLVFQIVGGTLATALAHRLHWFPVFAASILGLVIGWSIFDFHVSAFVFVGANSCVGFMALFINPYIVAMTIEADPTLRAAVQSAGAQVLGGAIGPALAVPLVGDQDVHGAIWLGVAMGVATMAIVTALHSIAVRERRRASTDRSSTGPDAGDIVFQGAGGAPVTIGAEEGGDHSAHERITQ
ncbi:MAG: hypothetical protein ABSD74_00375 [Rhizomicrobium sp.]|jgi:hypothetical protein